MKPVKILLTADDFQCLVMGEILVIKHKDGHETHIALQDIGFSNMHYLIGRAENGEEIYINREREG